MRPVSFLFLLTILCFPSNIWAQGHPKVGLAHVGILNMFDEIGLRVDYAS